MTARGAWYSANIGHHCHLCCLCHVRKIKNLSHHLYLHWSTMMTEANNMYLPENKYTNHHSRLVRLKHRVCSGSDKRRCAWQQPFLTMQQCKAKGSRFDSWLKSLPPSWSPHCCVRGLKEFQLVLWCTANETAPPVLASRRFCFCGFCLACRETAEPKWVGDATLASNEASLLRGIAGVLFIVNGFGCCWPYSNSCTNQSNSPIALLLFDFGMPYIRCMLIKQVPNSQITYYVFKRSSNEACSCCKSPGWSCADTCCRASSSPWSKIIKAKEETLQHSMFKCLPEIEAFQLIPVAGLDLKSTQARAASFHTRNHRISATARENNPATWKKYLSACILWMCKCMLYRFLCGCPSAGEANL